MQLYPYTSIYVHIHVFTCIYVYIHTYTIIYVYILCQYVSKTRCKLTDDGVGGHRLANDRGVAAQKYR